jgi:uracil-DNA glycosylase family 4
MKTKQSRLNALRTKMAKADLLLKAGAHHLVFGEGSAEAAIILVGEAPGKNEDLTGLPFIGSAGKILDQLLTSIALKRENIFITSILKYRPPKNRNPRLDEIINHTPYLIEQIKIIEPKVIVPLGNFATRFILNGFSVEKMQNVVGISKLHGKVETVLFEGRSFSVMPLYHPAAVLYNPPLRKTLNKDFQAIKKFVNS